MDEHSHSSREPDRVLDDHQLEGEHPTEDQAPPPPRPDMNAEETTGATPKGTGPGAQALDQMAPKTTEDIADDPSLQDVSNEEKEEKDPSPTPSLSSLNYNVTQQRYREPDDHQLKGELNSIVKNLGNLPPPRPYINAEETAGATSEGTGHGAQALDQKLPQIIKDFADAPSLHDVSDEEDLSPTHSLSSLNDNVACYQPTAGYAGGDNSEVLKHMNMLKRDNNDIQTDVVSLKTENYERKKENDEMKSQISEMKREMSEIKKEHMYSEIKNENSALKRKNAALEKENFALKTKMSNLEQAHRNEPIVRFFRNDTTSFQEYYLSLKAGMKASDFEDDDNDGTVDYTGGIDIPKEYNDQSDEEYYDACENQ